MIYKLLPSSFTYIRGSAFYYRLLKYGCKLTLGYEAVTTKASSLRKALGLQTLEYLLNEKRFHKFSRLPAHLYSDR